MAESKREYTAIFSIGARLLGSFRGAMASAQAGLKGLQSAAASAGAGLRRMALLYTGLIAAIGLGAFTLTGAVRKIFEGADEAAEASDQRTRKLIAGLMQLDAIRKRGRVFAESQAEELKKNFGLLDKQQLYGKRLLETGAAQLAIAKVPPKYIAQAVERMADLLAATKGVTATEQDMQDLAFGFGTAINRGATRSRILMQLLTKEQMKSLQAFAKTGNIQGAFNLIMKRLNEFKGESARALQTPEGRIYKLQVALEALRTSIGEALKPIKAEAADATRSILRDLGPSFIWLGTAVARSRARMIEAFASFIHFARGPLKKPWSELQKAWSDMTDQIGAAFRKMLGVGVGKTLQQAIVEKLIAAMKVLGSALKWVGDNAVWLVPLITNLAVVFAGLTPLVLAASAAMLITAGSPVLLGIYALIAALALVVTHWDKIKEHANAALDAMSRPAVKPAAPMITLPSYLLRPGIVRPPEGIPMRNAAPAGPLSFIGKGLPPGLVTAGQPGLTADADAAAALNKLASEAQKSSISFATTTEYAKNLGNGFGDLISAVQIATSALLKYAVPPPAFATPMPTIPGHAAGGIIRRPTLSWIAEKGAEAIIPLRGGDRSTGLLDYASRALGMSRPASGATTVHFAPQITIAGDASEDNLREMDSRLRDLVKTFISQFKAAQAQERRLSYESGYG